MIHCKVDGKAGLWISARLPVAGNFLDGQVKFEMYQPDWQGHFYQIQRDHCYFIYIALQPCGKFIVTVLQNVLRPKL